MAESLMGTMDALYLACQTIYASTKAADGSPVFVSFGDPGQYQPDAIVAVMNGGTSQPIARPTLGTNRSRELPLEVAVMFSVYTPGGPEVYQTSLDAVTSMVRQLEDYLRISPNERLGGACRDSWVSALAGPTGTVVYDPASVQGQSPVVTGRVVEATATVTALIRY